MGTLNEIANLPSEILRMHACIACHKPGVHPQTVDPGTTTYDYRCSHCNPNATISLAESCLSNGLLDQLKDNKQARDVLRSEIRSFIGEVFKVDINLIQYVLGITTDKPVTYEQWMEGNITGDVRKWTLTSPETLNKIQEEQARIFNAMVNDKLDQLIDRFGKRRANSFDPNRMLLKEIDDVQDILVKGRYKFETKPANEGFNVGAYFFRGYPIFTCIQDMYDAAVDGSIDFGYVPSPKQKISIPSMDAKVDCMVQAYGLAKFLMYLESLLVPKVQSNGNISDAGVKMLETRFDEMKKEFMDIVTKGFTDIDENQHKLFYELQSGQQVIFDEFDELKDFLKSMN